MNESISGDYFRFEKIIDHIYIGNRLLAPESVWFLEEYAARFGVRWLYTKLV